MKKQKILAISVALMSSVFVSNGVMAGVSANMGLASDYYFRGVLQSSGASGSAGIDYEHDSGLYVGTWLADVGGQGDVSASDGIEFDIYGGYTGEVQGFAYGIGYTSYQYTGDFDSAYNEFNLTASYGPVSFEFSAGTHDKIVGTTVNDQDEDYSFMAFAYEYESISVLYGIWGADLEGAYLEIAFSKTVSEIDLGVSLINGDAEENPSAGSRNFATDGTAIVFTLGKTFDL